MYYVKQSDKSLHHINDVRRENPRVSLPEGGDASSIGYQLLNTVPRPTPLPWHVIEERTPVNNTQVWEQRLMSSEEIKSTCIELTQSFIDASKQDADYGSIAHIAWEGTVRSTANTIISSILSNTTTIPSIETGFTALLPTRVVSDPILANRYQTENDEITITGDVTGSGRTSISLDLVDTGVVEGTYNQLTVDSKGRVTTGTYTQHPVIQVITSSISPQSGTSLITLTNNIPTNLLGSQIWSQTITPSAIENKIVVNGSFVVSSGTTTREITCCLFRDSTCIGVTGVMIATAARADTISFIITDAPTTTSSVTYSIRVGVNSSAVWHVNQTSTAYFGGKYAANGITLIELSPTE